MISFELWIKLNSVLFCSITAFWFWFYPICCLICEPLQNNCFPLHFNNTSQVRVFLILCRMVSWLIGSVDGLAEKQQAKNKFHFHDSSGFFFCVGRDPNGIWIRFTKFISLPPKILCGRHGDNNGGKISIEVCSISKNTLTLTKEMKKEAFWNLSTVPLEWLLQMLRCKT